MSHDGTLAPPLNAKAFPGSEMLAPKTTSRENVAWAAAIPGMSRPRITTVAVSAVRLLYLVFMLSRPLLQERIVECDRRDRHFPLLRNPQGRARDQTTCGRDSAAAQLAIPRPVPVVPIRIPEPSCPPKLQERPEMGRGHREFPPAASGGFTASQQIVRERLLVALDRAVRIRLA